MTLDELKSRMQRQLLEAIRDGAKRGKAAEAAKEIGLRVSILVATAESYAEARNGAGARQQPPGTAP